MYEDQMQMMGKMNAAQYATIELPNTPRILKENLTFEMERLNKRLAEIKELMDILESEPKLQRALELLGHRSY